MASLVVLAIGGALWSGFWRCPTAALFHFPCPACGSTRAMRGVLTGDFHAVWLNPLGPVAALLFAVIFGRVVWLELTEGDLRRLGDDSGKLAVRALVVVSAFQIVLWVLRLFGFFGGPVPV